MVKFFAELSNLGEVKSFLNNFYSLENPKVTKVEIIPKENHMGFNVVLEEEVGIGLLESTFRNGMMAHWGWDKKFTRI